MNEIKVSIIVPVYNTKEEYLRECFDSIINQTIKNEIEIIIVDDGSENKCAKICDEYALKYPNIQVIHQENQGLGPSRNNGMKLANGKWIMFVDSDDWIESNMCEKLLENEQDDIDIIISACNNCFTDKIKPVIMFGGKDTDLSNEIEKLELRIISYYVLDKESYRAPYLTIACAKMFRNSFIKNNELDKVCMLKFREDNIFSLYCFEYAKKIVYKNYYLYNYRQRSSSLIHSNSMEKVEQYIKYLEEEKKFILKYNKPYIFYEAYRIRVIQSIINIIEQYIFKSNISYIEKRKQIKKIINNEDFLDAIKNVNTMYLSKYLKIMLSLIRRKMYGLVNIVYLVRKFIKERDNKNMYN